MPSKVSIIIPVYNSSGYLKKSLESILSQTYSNKEIIVVDDGSSDNSFEIAKSFENRGIKIVAQKNAGAAVARNTGLEKATGKYIQFMDADDFLSLDKIEKQVEALEKNPHKIAVCNYATFVKDEELEKGIHFRDQSSFIYGSDCPEDFLINLWGGNGESNFIQTNCWLVPRSVIERSGGWREYRCPDDDGEFFARVILASAGIVFVPEVVNYYRREKTDYKLSSNSDKNYVQNTLLTIDLKYQYLSKKSTDARVDRAFAKQYLDFAVHQYPQHKELSVLALEKFKEMKEKARLPLLGGHLIEIIKNIFGWKTARLIKYYLR